MYMYGKKTSKKTTRKKKTSKQGIKPLVSCFLAGMCMFKLHSYMLSFFGETKEFDMKCGCNEIIIYLLYPEFEGKYLIFCLIMSFDSFLVNISVKRNKYGDEME